MMHTEFQALVATGASIILLFFLRIVYLSHWRIYHSIELQQENSKPWGNISKLQELVKEIVKHYLSFESNHPLGFVKMKGNWPKKGRILIPV